MRLTIEVSQHDAAYLRAYAWLRRAEDLGDPANRPGAWNPDTPAAPRTPPAEFLPPELEDRIILAVCETVMGEDPAERRLTP